MHCFISRALLFIAVPWIVNAASTPIDARTCGKTKSCYLLPTGCWDLMTGDTSKCSMAAAWGPNNNNNDELDITLQTRTDIVDSSLGGNGQAGLFIAFGLSASGSMPNTSVVNCLYDPKILKVTAQLSYNRPDFTGFSPPNDVIASDPGVSVSASAKDGVLVCDVLRPVKGSDARIFDATLPYWLILARGSADNATWTPGTFAMQRHSFDGRSSSWPRPTQEMYSIATTKPFWVLEPTATAPSMIDARECGKQLSCFMTPNDCWNLTSGDTSDCVKAASWTPYTTTNATHLLIKLQTRTDIKDSTLEGDGQTGLFIAFGMSGTGTMHNTSVVNCLYDPASNGRITGQITYNTPDFNGKNQPNNVLMTDPGVSLSSAVQNGVLVCNILRPIASVSEPRVFDLTNAYYPILARGAADNTTWQPGTFVMQRHSVNTSSSSWPVWLTSTYTLTDPHPMWIVLPITTQPTPAPAEGTTQSTPVPAEGTTQSTPAPTKKSGWSVKASVALVVAALLAF